MSAKDLIVQHASAPGGRLILLFHGVGSRPEDLVPLGRRLAEADPGAWVVSVCSPEPSDLGSGWQWFSVRGVTEDSRPARIATARHDATIGPGPRRAATTRQAALREPARRA